MDAHAIEEMLRRVVREELAALGLGGGVPAAPAPTRTVDLSSFAGTYDLTDGELRQAEKLLPEEEGKILRQRVYAARLEAAGNAASARRMRAKADRMEKQLQMREERRGCGH